jgi:hypothetical protein
MYDRDVVDMIDAQNTVLAMEARLIAGYATMVCALENEEL